jgi:hypothetical protein
MNVMKQGAEIAPSGTDFSKIKRRPLNVICQTWCHQAELKFQIQKTYSLLMFPKSETFLISLPKLETFPIGNDKD